MMPASLIEIVMLLQDYIVHQDHLHSLLSESYCVEKDEVHLAHHWGTANQGREGRALLQLQHPEGAFHALHVPSIASELFHVP